MLDWLTVLELAGAALVVLGVLSVIAHFVNQRRARAGATDNKARTVEKPSPVVTPEPRTAPPAANMPSVAVAVTLPPTDDVPPPSESLLPPVEPIVPVSDAPLPAVKVVPPASKAPAVRMPRSMPRAVPVARLKRAVRLKTTRSSTFKRLGGRPSASRRRISFAPVAKPKPTLNRRPKRVIQVRRKKITAPVTRSGKVGAHRSPRHILTRV